MEWLSAIAILAGVAGVVAAVVCMVSPRSVWLRSRWSAVPLLLLMFGSMGFTLIVAPELANDPKSGETRTAGFVLVGFWVLVAFGCHRLALRSRGAENACSPTPVPHDSRPPSRPAAEANGTRRPLRTESQAERVRISDVVDIQRPTPAKKARGTGATRSKLKQIPGAPARRIGTNAKFVYVNSDGEVSDREIVNWSIAGGYIEGFCLQRKQVRTFRLDRVDEWISAE